MTTKARAGAEGTVGEFALIARLDAIHRGAAHPGVEVSIGDDAAVLAPPGRTVWTVDAQVDHVHFERGWLSDEDVGFRAHAAATSDVYAMGAKPIASLASYVLPPGAAGCAEGFARGAAASADLHGAPTVGGNVSRGAELSVTTTVLGTCDAPRLRSGARPGDGVYLAGLVGHAALGFRVLHDGLPHAGLEAFVARWRRPCLPVAEAASLAHATAAIDVSDGLARDLDHVLAASGVGARIDRDAVVDEALAHAAASLGLDATALAFGGGEDYALLATGPAPLAGFRRIGTIVAAPGLRVVAADGSPVALPSTGHEHLF